MSTKGFTLMEMLLVFGMVAIIWILLIMSFPTKQLLNIEMKTIKEHLLQQQMQAMYSYERKYIEFHADSINFDGDIYYLNKGVHSDIYAFHFTDAGNISKAGRVCLYDNQQEKCFIFELGSGRIDIR